MLYQHLKTVRRVGKYVLLIVPLLVVLFFLLQSTQVSNFFTNTSHTLGKPFWALKDTISSSFSESVGSFQSKEDLLSENMHLRDELSRLQRETFMLESLREDNTKLHELLGHNTDTTGYISASVIHDGMLSAHDVFIIDVGATHGIRDNMLAVTPEGIAIGYISKVLETTAVARRFSSPTTNIDVILQGTTTIHATLTGHGSGTMKLTVPRDVEIERNDTIVLPSFSTHPIGTIASIIVSPEDAYKTAYLRSPVNMHELRFIHIDTTHTWDSKNISEQVELSLQPKEISTEEKEEENDVIDSDEPEEE